MSRSRLSISTFSKPCLYVSRNLDLDWSQLLRRHQGLIELNPLHQDLLVVVTSFLKVSIFSRLSRLTFWNCQDRDSRSRHDQDKSRPPRLNWIESTTSDQQRAFRTTWPGSSRECREPCWCEFGSSACSGSPSCRCSTRSFQTPRVTSECDWRHCPTRRTACCRGRTCFCRPTTLPSEHSGVRKLERRGRKSWAWPKVNF